MHGKQQCVSLLINARANLSLSHDGMDALAWAQQRGQARCVALLEAALAQEQRHRMDEAKKLHKLLSAGAPAAAAMRSDASDSMARAAAAPPSARQRRAVGPDGAAAKPRAPSRPRRLALVLGAPRTAALASRRLTRSSSTAARHLLRRSRPQPPTWPPSHTRRRP